MKILAIIVTYYPDKGKLINNINSFKDNVDKILIWENTPKNESDLYRYIEDDKIEYCGPRENVGIPKALNYAWYYANKNSYDYVLTMDQDSLWVDFNQYLNSTIRSKQVNNVIWGPNPEQDNHKRGIVERSFIITSGMIASTNILNLIGGWPETFKVDCVDIDFCYNAKLYGIQFLQVQSSHIEQNYGVPQKSLSLSYLNLRSMPVYSPARLYAMSRNGIILKKKYNNFPIISYLYRAVLDSSKRILLHEDNKKEKIRSIFKGVIDGIKFKYEKE